MRGEELTIILKTALHTELYKQAANNLMRRTAIFNRCTILYPLFISHNLWVEILRSHIFENVDSGICSISVLIGN